MAEIAERLHEIESALWSSDDVDEIGFLDDEEDDSELRRATLPPASPRRGHWPMLVAASLVISAGGAFYLLLPGSKPVAPPGRARALPGAVPRSSHPATDNATRSPRSLASRGATSRRSVATTPEGVAAGEQPNSGARRGKTKKRRGKRKRGGRGTRAAPAGGIDPHYGQGLAYLKERKVLLAIEQLEIACRREPRHAEAHRALGKAYALVGRESAASRAFERYLKLAPDARDAPKLRALIDAYDKRQ
jgi:hypothetical protein